MILYKTVMEQAEAEQIIEKSRFISHIKHVTSKVEADEFIAEIRAVYKTATHNVPAFVIGDKMQLQWASDDGEPQGTSGAPIVQMLVKEGITNAAVVVTRYFGGVKLGTGGLVRAYTSSAKLALNAAGIANVCDMLMLEVCIDYSYLAKIKNAAGQLFNIEDIGYAEFVNLQLSADPENGEKLKSFLADITAGSARIISEKNKQIKVRVI